MRQFARLSSGQNTINNLIAIPVRVRKQTAVAKVPGQSDNLQKNQAPLLRKAGLYLGVAFELPGTIFGGLVIGYYADEYLHTSPWLLLICATLAFIGAFVRLLQWAKFFARERNGSDRT